MVDIRQRQFDGAASAARPAAGEALIDAILAALAERQKTGARPDEASYCKRALMVARAVRSDRAAALDGRLKELEQAARLAFEVENLKKQLAAKPDSPPVRLRLVRLLLVDMDDAAEAAKYVEGVQDAGLAKYVPAAARPLEGAPELACLELGDWYRSLADTAPAAAKGAMFARAQAYYKRFLELHTAEDIGRAKAVAALQKIETDLQAAAPKPAPAAKPAPPPAKTSAPGPKAPVAGQPIDLLALVDPDACVVSGKCRREGEAIVVSGRIMLPVVVSGSYDLTVTLKRTGGGDTVGIILPVGSRTVLLGLGYYGNSAHGLDQVNGKNGADPANPTVLKPARLENNRQYVAHARVLVQGSMADIQVDLDGTKIITWNGPTSAFTMYEGWRLPEPNRIGMGVSNGSAVFSSARLVMLSGQAKVLAPAEAK